MPSRIYRPSHCDLHRYPVARAAEGLHLNFVNLLTATIVLATTAFVLPALNAAETLQAQVVASDSFGYEPGRLRGAKGGNGWAAASDEGWKTSAQDSPRVVAASLGESRDAGLATSRGGSLMISGAGRRNNPLRRQLAEPYTGESLYVRFLLRYDAASIDNIADGDGEFFVLWLDDIDGGDGATHNPNVPNIGIRIHDSGPREQQKNLFMVRIGDKNSDFSNVELTGDRTYLVVGRLSKTRPSLTGSFDQFSLWIDPQPGDEASPLATARGRSSNVVRWIGFSTGLKTEREDRIQIDELVLADSWGVALGLNTAPALKPVKPPVATVDFRREVYPLIKDRCFGCHAGQDAEAGFRMDVRAELLGHTSGHALVTIGNSDSSMLIERITSSSADTRMPLDEDPLTDGEIALLRRWIDQGLAWDDQLLPPPKLKSDHWAFQPIVRPPVPDIIRRDGQTPPSAIDAFLAHARAKIGLMSNGPAERRTLIRRLSFDLTGLPPTPEDVEAFVADESDGAYETLVERLLDSPAYGERWGRHWLDVARWAESNGYQHDDVRRHAWRYRDYVIRSFNEDKPYDQFLREQIAGDELSPQTADALIATGFLAAAQVSGNEMDEAIRRNDILVDIVNTTASAVLGLTMQCAQCHNHKFDPISARDYYRFQAFFVKGQLSNLVLPGGESNSPAESPQTWGFVAPSTSPVPVQRLPLKGIRYPLPYNPQQLSSARAHLLVRGDVQQPGAEVDAGWPAIFRSVPDTAKVEQRPRSALADWLTDRRNPLTARVWVNRIWHYHFGRGLVGDPSDFGVRTDPPLHQALLDWLAVELIDSGWSTKHVHRLIVNSDTYRLSAGHSETAASKDPENAYYWRWEPRRLEVEAIHDALLSVSGELDLTRGGPSVPSESRGGQGTALRRTVYLAQKRSALPRIQELFDGADAAVHCSRRRVSTMSLQPLYLLNSEFVLARAKSLARRVFVASPDDRKGQIDAAICLVLCRAADPEEFARSIEYLDAAVNAEENAEKQGDQTPGSPPPELIRFCHALLNLNEFVYIE